MCIYIYIYIYIYMYNGMSFSLSKRKILPFPTTWMNLLDIMPFEISQTQKWIILYDLTNMWNLKSSSSKEHSDCQELGKEEMIRWCSKRSKFQLCKISCGALLASRVPQLTVVLTHTCAASGMGGDGYVYGLHSLWVYIHF